MNSPADSMRFWGKTPSIATEDLKKLQSGAEAMGSSEGKERLKRDIKELSNSTLELMAAFGRVEERLEGVGSSGSPKLQADINALQKRWKKYRQRYQDLLQESREVAGAAEGAVKDVSTDLFDFLMDEGATPKDKKAEISAMLKKLTKDCKKAEKTSAGFIELVRKVKRFQEKWKRVVQDRNVNITEEAQKLETEIKELQEKLIKQQEKFDKVSEEIPCQDGVSGILSYLVPTLWFQYIASSIHDENVLNAQIHVKETERALTSKKEAKDMLDADSSAAEYLLVALRESEGDIRNICRRLGAFGKVWAAIRADLQSIHEKLTYAKNSQTAEMLDKRINTAVAMYKVLGEVLREYQTCVTSEDNDAGEEAGYPD